MDVALTSRTFLVLRWAASLHWLASRAARIDYRDTGMACSCSTASGVFGLENLHFKWTPSDAA
jgi:hypothetical protein